MTYEHKDHMEWLLQKTDYYTENAVTEERIQEIREVYAKAKAFDEIMEHLEKEYDYDNPASGDMYEDGEKQQLIIDLWKISESEES